MKKTQVNISIELDTLMEARMRTKNLSRTIEGLLKEWIHIEPEPIIEDQVAQDILEARKKQVIALQSEIQRLEKEAKKKHQNEEDRFVEE